ncbi:MAG TPA: penicillin-binding protein 2 [Hyphomicrobiaceae bacterium]|nr:penicillin-binding protein 2 [Hyphomicrobiaceae bacterium]
MFFRDPDSSAENPHFSRRAALLALVQAGAFAAITSRLYHLQIVEHNRYALLAEENKIAIDVLSPTRGRILDAHGRVLAYNTDGYRVVVVPSLAGNVDEVLRRLQRILAISERERMRLVARSQRQSPTTPLIVAQNLDWDTLATLNLNAPYLPGVRTEPGGRRIYHGGAAIGHVVGYVGAVERRAMDDAPVLRLPWMRIGKSGVEAGLEATLRGTAGRLTSEVDARGRHIRTMDRVDPVPGADVKLTLDLDLQSDIVQRLSEFKRASAVVMDVRKGDIVAAASVPGFDPSVLLEANSGSHWAALNASPDDPLVNRATRGLYPPGSTFKIVTALAALEAGVISTTEQIDCTGTYHFHDQTFRCWNRTGHGRCNLHEALRESCDYYFYDVARRVGISAIAGMARRLGFGRTFDAAFAGQKAGIVPDPDWKRGRFGRSWLGGETLLAGIGQGYVLSTPLQLAVMTSRIATGLDVMPRLVQEDAASQAPDAGSLGISDAALTSVRRALHAVVNESGGTGRRARAEVGSYEIAGKTGTSQVGRASADTAHGDLPWDQRDHSLFVCYAPASQPRFAVSVVIEHGGSGGSVAAPVARDIVDLAMMRATSREPAAGDGDRLDRSATGRG